MDTGKYVQIFRDYVSVILGMGFSRLLSLLAMMIFARSLGTNGFGVFSIYFTIMNLIAQLPTAIDSTYVRYVKAEALDKESKTSCLRATMLIKIAIFVILIVLSFFVGYVLAYNVYDKANIFYYIVLAIISGAFLSLSSTLSGVYQADEKIIKYSIFNLLFNLGVIILILPIYLFNLPVTVDTAVGINTLISVLICIPSFLFIYRRVKKLFPLDIPMLINMIHFSKWLLATNLLYIILQRLDILFIANNMDFSSIGIYSVAVRMAMASSLFIVSIPVILMPKGSQALKSPKHLKAYLTEAAMIVPVLVLIIFALIIIAPFLIRVLFGAQYLEAVLYTRILFCDSIITALYTPLMYLFYADNKGQYVFILGVIMLAVVICGLSLLIPRFGLMGAALSIVISSFCGLIFIIFNSTKIIKRTYGYV